MCVNYCSRVAEDIKTASILYNTILSLAYSQCARKEIYMAKLADAIDTCRTQLLCTCLSLAELES